MWIVYILICSDQTLYTGITNNLEKRLRAHNGIIAGGAKYTKHRRPVKLFRSFDVSDRPAALKLEYRIKQLSREEKLKFTNE